MTRVGILNNYDNGCNNSLLILEENNETLRNISHYGCLYRDDYFTPQDLWYLYFNEEWEELKDHLIKAKIGSLFIYDNAELCDICHIDKNNNLTRPMDVTTVELKEVTFLDE